MWYKKLEVRVKEILKDNFSGHNINHSYRVLNVANFITENEGVEIDRGILFAATLLHDTGYTKFDPEDPKYLKHPDKSVEIAKKILPEIGFPKEKLPITLEAIKLHDDIKPWGQKRRSENREVWYIQDADCVEGVGAMGISRIIAYCSKVKMPLYNPELSFDDSTAKEKSMIHDLYAHLEVFDNLNTQTARDLAKPRKEIIEKFINDFIEEYDFWQ